MRNASRVLPLTIFHTNTFKYVVNYQYAVWLELYTNPNPTVLGLRNEKVLI